MRLFHKVASGIPTDDILAELACAPDLWDQNSERKYAKDTPHAQMSDIWLRYNDNRPYAESGDYTHFNDAHIPVWYPGWARLKTLHPIVSGLMAEVGGEMLGGVLITKIPPGGVIKRHVDRGWHVEYFATKYYFQLQNDPGCVFGASDGDVTEELTPKAGDIWGFDNRNPHWVVNNSGRDRITCIICIRSNYFQEYDPCLGQ